MLHDKDGRVVKVYPYGSEEQLRWELVLEYLLEIDRRYLEKLLQKKVQQRQEVEQILAVPDQTVVHRRQRRRVQRYNLTQAKKILQVTKQKGARHRRAWHMRDRHFMSKLNVEGSFGCSLVGPLRLRRRALLGITRKFAEKWFCSSQDVPHCKLTGDHLCRWREMALKLLKKLNGYG